MAPWNRRFLLETIIFRFHVKLGEGNRDVEKAVSVAVSLVVGYAWIDSQTTPIWDATCPNPCSWLAKLVIVEHVHEISTSRSLRIPHDIKDRHDTISRYTSTCIMVCMWCGTGHTQITCLDVICPSGIWMET